MLCPWDKDCSWPSWVCWQFWAAGERGGGWGHFSPGQLHPGSQMTSRHVKCVALWSLELNQSLAEGSRPQPLCPYCNCWCVWINPCRDKCRIKCVRQTNQRADQLCTVIYSGRAGMLNPFFHKSPCSKSVLEQCSGCQVLCSQWLSVLRDVLESCAKIHQAVLEKRGVCPNSWSEWVHSMYQGNAQRAKSGQNYRPGTFRMFLAAFTSRCKSAGCIKSQRNSDAKWEPLRSPGGDSLGWRRAWLLLIKIAVPGSLQALEENWQCFLQGKVGTISESRCTAQSTPQTCTRHPGLWQWSASWTKRTRRKAWSRGDEKLVQLPVVKMPFTVSVLTNNPLRLEAPSLCTALTPVSQGFSPGKAESQDFILPTNDVGTLSVPVNAL